MVEMTPDQRRELKEKFEHALKLTAENKITRSNAFDENFGKVMRHLPSLVLDALDLEGMNFQKASGGLETGVRIFDKRVDACFVEVHHVLGHSMPADGSDEDNDSSQQAGDQDGSKARKQRNKTAADATATLASAEALVEKKQDACTFESDPLFCRTSKLFDENSTAALLLLNYPVHQRTHIMFDGEEKPFDHLTPGLSEQQGELDVQLDLSQVRGLAELVGVCSTQRITPTISHLYQALEQAQGGRAVPPIQLDNTAIVKRALGSRYVNPTASTQVPTSSQTHSSLGGLGAAAAAAAASLQGGISQDNMGSGMDMDVDMEGPQDVDDQPTAAYDDQRDGDVLGGSAGVEEEGDDAAGFDDDNDDAAWGAHSPVHVGLGAAADGVHAGNDASGGSYQDEQDEADEGEEGAHTSSLLGVAMPEPGANMVTGKGKGRVSNWTVGSGTWRYRTQAASKAAAQATRARVSRRKEVVVVDWEAACLDIDEDAWEKAMAAGNKKTTKKTKPKPRALYQPPEFQVEQLDCTSAGWSVGSALRTDLAAAAMARNKARTAAAHTTAPEQGGMTQPRTHAADTDEFYDAVDAAGFNNDGEPEGEAAGRSPNAAAGLMSQEGGYWGPGGGDDEDVVGMDDGAVLVEELEGDGIVSFDPLSVEALLPPPRKTAHLQVTYDKSAKQVDIKALKDRMQQRMDLLSHKDDCVPAQDQGGQEDAAAKQPGISMHKVLHELPVEGVAGIDDRRDMSVHLAFICLLHLANENGLQLRNDGQLDQLNIQGWVAA